MKNYQKKKKIIYKIIIFVVNFFAIIEIKEQIKVMYYISKNLGDNLNSFLLKKMLLRRVSFDNVNENVNIGSKDQYNIYRLDKIAKTDLLFIGSILETLSNMSYIFTNKTKIYKSIIFNYCFKIYDYFFPLKIFGTGFISQNNKNESYIRNIKIIAVRGNITLQRFRKNGLKISKNVVLADPALLTPIILKINQSQTYKKLYKLCIIPHYIDQDNILIKERVKVPNSSILNISEEPYEFIDNLLKCERVISSGLHGLILSDAFGIPNLRMVLSNKIIGGDYKFNDYYSSYGIYYHLKIDLRKTTFTLNNLNIIDNNYNISIDMITKKRCQLLINFPYRLNKYLYLQKKSCINLF